jgi:Cu/Zn superoxide dismutase
VRNPSLLLIAATGLALAGCSGGEEELAEQLTAVTEGAVQQDPLEAEEDEEEEEDPEGAGVAVEIETDLVDAEGSIVGTAWFRDEDDRAMVEVQVAGLTAGFHPMYLYPLGTCQFGETSIDGADLLELPPVLVLETGVGSITTLAGSNGLDELLTGDGSAVLIGPAVEGLGDIPTVSEQVAPLSSGSQVACGAIGD